MHFKRLRETSAFLSQNPIPMFIGGKWIQSGQSFEVMDPGLGKTLAHVSEGGEKEIHHAVEAAGNAFREAKWASLTPADRAQYLNRLGDLIDQHKEILAEIEALDVGKNLKLAAGDIGAAAETFRYFADLLLSVPFKEIIPNSQFHSYTIRKPYGVCGFIFPWNFPFLLLAWGIAPALAAGNSVVVKPAENTPLSTLYFCKLVEEAGIPHGIVNVVPGMGSVAGAALSKNTHIKRMSFTGSPEVGKLVAEACSKNLCPVKLELGGKGAAVILKDVEIDKVAASLATIITCNTGQMCCTASRWLVDEKIYRPFAEAAVEHMKKTAIGYAMDEKAYMGPVVSETQRKRILQLIDKGEKTGAKSLLKMKAMGVRGGEEGYYISPGLMEGSPQNICAQAEIFGPVAYLIPFKTEKEAVEIVHSTPYGLGNSVWSQDLHRAEQIAESLEAGINWVNTHNAFFLGVPYAGYNLSGLGGGVNSMHTLLDYFRLTSIVRPQPETPVQGV